MILEMREITKANWERNTIYFISVSWKSKSSADININSAYFLVLRVNM